MISAEFNKTLQTSITSANLVLAFITLLLFIYNLKKPHTYASNSLRLYFKICLEPYAILIVLLSIFEGLHFHIFHNFNTISYQLIRFWMAFCAQQVRLSYFFLVTSRILATAFYKSYSKHSSSTKSLVYTIIITYFTSFINAYFEYLRVFCDLNINFFTIYIVLSTHVVTLTLCKVLYWVNFFKYQSIAYHSSLSERHQIYENVKVLKTLWPLILIFSVIAPIGPAALVCYKFVAEVPPPSALVYLSYNMSFIFIMVWSMLKSQNLKQHVNVIGKNISVFVNNSKISPEIIAVERYFNDLQAQWK